MKLTGLAVLVSGGLLAACAQDETRGFTKISEDGKPFAQAHAQCLTEGMNTGGFSSVPQMRVYDACMARNGWQDQRAPFGGTQAAPKIARATPGNQQSFQTCRAQAIENNVSGEQLHRFLESCTSGVH